MQNEELMSMKEHGQKGNFMLPIEVVNTIMPEFYTTYPMHWHEEMEIVYVKSGELEENIDLDNFFVKAGDIVLISPCVLHSFRIAEGRSARFRSIIFNMSMLTNNSTDACSIKYFTPFVENSYVTPVVISPDQPYYRELQTVVRRIIAIYDSHGEFYELRLKACLYDLFYVLFNYFFIPEEREPSIKDTTTRNIKIILDYIAENYTRPITIDELAGTVNLSKHYFMRFFKKYMGLTCIEYINDYRLNVAANMLLSTSLQITEVSEKIGISNLSYFNRIFKKKYNMTPKEYRYNMDGNAE